MKKLTTRFVPLLLAFLLLMSACGKTGGASAGTKKFTLEITYSDGSVKSQEIETDKATVGEALKALELIDGEAYMMSTPSRIHQEISVAITSQLYNFLEGKRCKVYPAPFSVRLFEKDGDPPEKIDTVVEPDITVICDRSKLDKRGCKGAPDLIIEILSPSTQRHDRLVKLNLYQRAGVREYWIVNPSVQTVITYHFASDDHNAAAYSFGDEIPVGIYDEDLKICLENLL